MRARCLEVAVAAAAIAAAGPAAAGQGPSTSVLRAEMGFGQISWNHSCRISAIDTCDWSSFAGPGLLVLGATYDRPMGGTANLSGGARLLVWKSGGTRKFEVEPTLGLTWKFTVAQWLEARLHAGGGLYLGSALGPALRLGGGMGVGLSSTVSLGIDLLVEAGILGGYLNMTSSVTLGPAFSL